MEEEIGKEFVHMRYMETVRQQNELVEERFLLVMERLEGFVSENNVKEPFKSFFMSAAKRILKAKEVLEFVEAGKAREAELEELKRINEEWFKEAVPGQYDTSYLNPTYAVKTLGEDYGQLLCVLYADLMSLYDFAFEENRFNITIFSELVVELFHGFEEEEQISAEDAKKTMYWFYHDYSEIFQEAVIAEQFLPEYDFYTSIIRESDVSDLRYLYQFGQYIDESVLKTAEFMNRLSEEEIDAMAETYIEGYRKGFEVAGKDLSKKKVTQVHYPLGFERVVQAAFKKLSALGLEPVIMRDKQYSFSRAYCAGRGAYGVSVNKQYEYDHKNDKALYFDKGFVERRLEVAKVALEDHKEMIEKVAGPAVIEKFGEVPFSPEKKAEALELNEKQQQLNVYYMSQNSQLINQYVNSEERSFTIIAYPIPDIGPDFEAIFRETVKINTLDYTRYQEMQQIIIDVLDQADYVEVKGCGKNKTDLKVNIAELANPEKETAFENCLADVNIPIGEVFTSPVLEKTTGKLFVSKVYLNGLEYRDLEIDFQDGMIADYTCSNFDDEQECKKYIHENVLFNHDTLPIGEFAIGTNTTAYRMGRTYKIEDKLPILIAEKTGPHFAVGDTCYAHEEDVVTYNPDGKAIVARENAVSALRKEDMSKAYLNCHTDITIPYDELASITSVCKNGDRIDIIKDGRFVLPGIEELNIPLD